MTGLRIFAVLLFFTSYVQAAEGDLLVTASIAEPSNLIPILASDSASQDIVSRVFSGLLRYNPKLELEGDLAEAWEILDEGKTILFHLRRGVRWHDGAPFTSRDVVFTYQKLIDPQVPTPYSGDYMKVETCEALDDFTVRVTYKESFSPALSSWTMWIMPKHLLEKEDFLKTPFSRKPVGTGTYRFKRWVDGDRIELAVYPAYHEGRPKIDGIVSRVVPDQTTMFLELHQESIDTMGLTPIQYKKLTSGAFFEKRYRKFRYPSLGYTYLGFNLLNPMFQDVRVRQALNLAVNKDEIIKGILLGLGRECTGPFTPESWAFNPQVKPAPYDPERARALLKEAGWEDRDKDGVFDKEGVPFEFTLITNHGNFQRILAAQIIQRRLGEIGVKVRLKVIEWSAFLKEFIDKKRFEACLLGWGLGLEPDPFDIWHSSKTGEGEFNFISYKNARVDELIEKGRRIFDRNERRAVYFEIQKILYEEQPIMFLYIADSLPILSSRFKNVEVTPLGLGYDFIRWEVPKEERKYKRYVL